MIFSDISTFRVLLTTLTWAEQFFKSRDISLEYPKGLKTTLLDSHERIVCFHVKTVFNQSRRWIFIIFLFTSCFALSNSYYYLIFNKYQILDIIHSLFFRHLLKQPKSQWSLLAVYSNPVDWFRRVSTVYSLSFSLCLSPSLLPPYSPLLMLKTHIL